MKQFFRFFLLFFVLLISYQNYGQDKVWALVLEKDYRSQKWKTRVSFPASEIRDAWNDGYRISSLTYGDGVWAIVYSKISKYTVQKYYLSKSFPKDKIKKGWDDGYDITSLAYGDGQWAVIMSKYDKYELQRWRTRVEFPKEEIKKGWDEGFIITSLVYGDGVWALVMDEPRQFVKQKWYKEDHFPNDEISEGWDQGYDIQSLEFGDGIWALVMTKDTDNYKQKWKKRTYFPEDEIAESWKDGYAIKYLSFGPEEAIPDLAATTSPSTPYTPSKPSIATTPDTDEAAFLKELAERPAEVTIGGKVWMTKNLDVSYFRNGDPIPQVTTAEEWVRAGKDKRPAWCYYNNDSKNGNTYGKLYNMYAVNDPRGLAPYGWKIPTKLDFYELMGSLGSDAEETAKRLKTTNGWSMNGTGTNSSGFYAVPSGIRSTDGTFMRQGGYMALHGASVELKESDGTAKEVHTSIGIDTEYNVYGATSAVYGLSVRCIKE
mgnify:CR=1 FL=1